MNYRVTILGERRGFVEVELAVIDDDPETELAVELLLPPHAVDELAARYKAKVVRKTQ